MQVAEHRERADLLRVVQVDRVERRDGVDHAVREVEQALGLATRARTRTGTRGGLALALLARVQRHVPRLAPELNAQRGLLALNIGRVVRGRRTDLAEVPQDGAEADPDARRLVSGEVRHGWARDV